MKNDDAVRKHVLYLLGSGGAHVGFDEVTAEFPTDLRGKILKDIPYTGWDLLEHLRIAQWDILEFSRNPKHRSPGFPDGYWPQDKAPSSGADWDNSVSSFRSDLMAMQGLVRDRNNDLFTSIPHGNGQTLLREALLVADHNAYHLGQMVVLRRLLGCWDR
jgi:hypothetical protein